jgi:hypothetical protein
MGTAIAQAIAAALRWGADFFDGENTAAMVAQKRAQNQQALKDKINADVAAKKVDEVRDDIAS